MRISGTLVRNGIEYFLYLIQGKGKTGWVLVSPYHKEDLHKVSLGEAASYPVLTADSLCKRGATLPYVISCIKNTAKESLCYGSTSQLEVIITYIQETLAHAFKTSDIEENYFDGKITKFSAFDGEIRVSYLKDFRDFKYLIIEAEDFHLNLTGDRYKLAKKLKIPLEPYNSGNNSRRNYIGINQITYEELAALYDLSHHKGRDWRSISTIEDFEKYVIDEFIEEYLKNSSQNKMTYLVNDVETNGLNVFDMPKQFQSTICAISLAWKMFSARLIYTDMEYIESIPIEYVKERLEPIFRYDFSNENNIFEYTYSGGTVQIDRNKIQLVNTNTMFDQRAYLVHNIDIFYDVDIMVLVFALSPFHTKGDKSLKKLEKYFLGEKAMSLKDVLGAGNEDKYRYIKDRRVAEAYACPDSDGLLQVFFKLRELYDDCESFFTVDLWEVIQSQYPILQYILASSSFYGIRVNKEKFLKEAKIVETKLKVLEELVRKLISYHIELRKIAILKLRVKEQGLRVDIKIPKIEDVAPYEGKLAGEGLRNILYKDLAYPPKSWTRANKNAKDPSKHVKKPSLDKTAMKLLSEVKSNNNIKAMTEDLVVKLEEMDEEEIVIKADDVNQCRYPIAYILTQIGPLRKEYDSYYKPFIGLLEYSDRIFKGDRTTTIDTFRIANPLQIIKSSIKEAFMAFDDDCVLVDFDKAQIELRVVAAISEFQQMIDIMDIPESDIHRERAAFAHKVQPHEITSKQRTEMKKTVFGLIYGLSDYGVAYNLHGNTEPDSIEQAKLIVQKTKEEAFPKIFTRLDELREEVLIPREVPKSLKDFLGIDENVPVGLVYSPTGVYKLFELIDLDKKKIKRIKNQVGNFPVQNYAGYIFKNSIINLFLECWKLGWWQKKYFRFHLTIHDELLSSMNYKKLSPYEVVKVITDTTIYRVKGHPVYYVGINFIENWLQGKSGDWELPARLSLEIAEKVRKNEVSLEPVENPVQVMMEERNKFLHRRLREELEERYPLIFKGKLDTKQADKRLNSYIVRGYLQDLAKPLWKADENNAIEVLEAQLCGYALQNYVDELIIRRPRGDKYKLTKEDLLKSEYKPSFRDLVSNSLEQLQNEINIEDIVYEQYTQTKAEMDEEFYKNIVWSFEDDSFLAEVYYEEEKIDEVDSFLREEYIVDENNKITSIRKAKKEEYENISVLGNTAHVKLKCYNIAMIVKEIKRIENEAPYSNKRVKTILHAINNTKIVVGPEVEVSILKDVDGLVNKFKV